MSVQFLSQVQAARLLGISRSSFLRAVSDGHLPGPVFPTPRRPRWRSDHLLEKLGGPPYGGGE
jgi:predicted DNA-binding transcriptional regulator AlpA